MKKDTGSKEKGKNTDSSSPISSSSTTSTSPLVAETTTTVTTATSSITNCSTMISPPRPQITSHYTKKIFCPGTAKAKSPTVNDSVTTTDTSNSTTTTTTNNNIDATNITETTDPKTCNLTDPVRKYNLPFTTRNAVTPPKPSPKRYTEMDTNIMNYVMPILHRLLPLLTVTVFEKYEEEAQFKLAEVECKALYKNTKQSQMSNDVNIF